MDAPSLGFTVADFNVASRLAPLLDGTAKDAEATCNEELDLEFTAPIGRALDTLVWLCADCEHWVPTREIKDEVCYSCHPGALDLAETET